MSFFMKGYILLSLLFSTSNGYSGVEDISDVYDLCLLNRHMDDRYMEENSSFQLHIHSDAKSDGNDKLMLHKHKGKCSLTFKLCSSCHMNILIQDMDIPSCSHDCSCNHFVIHEPLSDYESKKYCGVNKNLSHFESLTKVVQFDFVQSVHKKFHVLLTFNVSRNMYLVTENGHTRTRYIETPFFPAEYPSDYSVDYYFQAARPNGYVELVFLDFWLSQMSYVQITGHNGTHSEMFYGTEFRPPAIVSTGPSLSLKFVANNQNNKYGFRAAYSFRRKISGKQQRRPYTACGGSRDDEGDIMKLTIPRSMTSKHLFDCIWIINPPHFVQTSQFLYTAVIKYQNIAENSSLKFRKGLTSKSELLYQCEDFDSCTYDMPDHGITLLAGTGLYVRFRGYVDKDSSLVILYYLYRQNILEDCNPEEFTCGDGKCVSRDFRCDGYIQCSDGADEKNCSRSTQTTKPRRTTTTEDPDILEFPTKERVVLHGSPLFLSFIVVGCCAVAIFVIVAYFVVYKHMKGRNDDDDDDYDDEMEEMHTVPPTSFAPHRIVPFLGPYRLPFRDRPPSYDHVVNFDAMYPPLLYLRGQQRAETSLNQGISDHGSHSSTSSGQSNLFDVSNVASGSLNFPGSAKNVKKSISLDSGLNKLHFEVPACSCYLLNGPKTCVHGEASSFPTPCNMGLKQEGSIKLKSRTTNRAQLISCYLRARKTADNRMILSLRRNDGVSAAPCREKTNSF